MPGGHLSLRFQHRIAECLRIYRTTHPSASLVGLQQLWLQRRQHANQHGDWDSVSRHCWPEVEFNQGPFPDGSLGGDACFLLLLLARAAESEAATLLQ